MKSLDLKQIGLQELTTVETRSVDGGCFGACIAVGLAIAYLASTAWAIAHGSNPHTGGNMP